MERFSVENSYMRSGIRYWVLPIKIGDYTFNCGYISLKKVNTELMKEVFEKFQEITFNEKDIIGFDTMHIYNNVTSQTFNSVQEELITIIDAYCTKEKEE